jgi:pimeloyl-ACP methyl ester carboxylesterase
MEPMAFFSRGTARIYYEDHGEGEPIIAVHGLIENTSYWNDIAEGLAQKYRFIPMDMRGHGQSVTSGAPHGFDCETIGEDVIALADHLGIKRFHLLTHSTGGFAGVRYAMHDSGRLASLTLTDTGSATSVLPGDAESIRAFHAKFARSFEKYDWDEIIAAVRVSPSPFFRGITESPRALELLQTALAMVRQGERASIAEFIRSFYTDPDPKVEGLRKISCPVLIVYGEKDDLFIEPSKLMAREIPGARIIEYPGVGHMTALECPELLRADLLDFLAAHPL